jgi:trehalose 6-phosphate phosphatase
MTHGTITPLQDALAGWDGVRERLAGADDICILSDFDGTLSPLVDTPAAAGIDPDVSMVLRRLCTHRRVTLAVLSGRAVTDLQARIGLPLTYAGDHGLEIQGPGFVFTAPGSESVRHELPGMCEQLRRAMAHITGSLVECKRLSASVHFRHVDPGRLSELERAVWSCIDQQLYEIRSGRFVWEIRPRLHWDKGDAARWILHRQRASQQHAICLGDDHTDAEMFRRLPRAINVQVGFDGCDLGAQYWLPQGDVAQFLLCVLAHVNGSHRRASSVAAGG